MYRAFLAIVLLLSACTSPEPGPESLSPNDRELGYATRNEEGKRYCSGAGGFGRPVCSYFMDELDEIGAEPRPVRITGYLLRENNQLTIAERGDGSGVRVLIASLPDDAKEWFIYAIIDFQVAARGMYDPSKGTMEVESIGQLAHPLQPSPNFPPPDQRN